VNQRPHEKEPPTRDEGARQFWRQVASLSSLGWSLVLPIVGGALLGSYLDRLTGRDYMWTLALIVGGAMMSFYNLYHILYEETKD
jgi:ATP synthase protein I